jgi:choline-glycine betaine transporter
MSRLWTVGGLGTKGGLQTMNTLLFFLAGILLLFTLAIGTAVFFLYLFASLVEAEYWDF